MNLESYVSIVSKECLVLSRQVKSKIDDFYSQIGFIFLYFVFSIKERLSSRIYEGLGLLFEFYKVSSPIRINFEK